jgi:hypothetical protein
MESESGEYRRDAAKAGVRVISALGEEEAMSSCVVKADLLVLGHSVPRDKNKQ